MTALVSGDTPDLEAERLLHEGDVEGLVNHFQQQIRDAGGDASDEKGGQ